MSAPRYMEIATFMRAPLIDDPDPSGTTALVGATMMYELLCLLAEGR